MKAIITLQLWMEVESPEEAASACIEADQGYRMNTLANLEKKGADLDVLAGHLGYLGASYWLIDEEKVLP